MRCFGFQCLTFLVYEIWLVGMTRHVFSAKALYQLPFAVFKQVNYLSFILIFNVMYWFCEEKLRAYRSGDYKVKSEICCCFSSSLGQLAMLTLWLWMSGCQVTWTKRQESSWIFHYTVSSGPHLWQVFWTSGTFLNWVLLLCSFVGQTSSVDFSLFIR